jgi:phosphatidylglycerol lysyltransferase
MARHDNPGAKKTLHHLFIPIRHFWWFAASGGAGYSARYVRARINFVLAERRRRRLPDPTGELLRLQTLHGYNAHSLVSIAPGAMLWSTPEIDGAIIYSEFGRVWLAAGEPLAAAQDKPALARQFGEHARRHNRVVAFVPATTSFACSIASRDFSAVKVGAAPYFDLKTWNPRGDSAKKLRAEVNQARRAGVTVESVKEIDNDLEQEAADLCLRWLGNRRAATSFGWLVALDPFRHADHKKYFIARVNGNLVGFLGASPIPARKGWYLEDVLREPDGPPGTATLLVFEALQALKKDGAELATLGTAPLANDGSDEVSTDHPVVAKALRVAAKRFSGVYNFEGLRRFKSKFAPSWWESEYVVAQRGIAIPPRVANAIMRALVPRGLPQLLTRQALRLIRGKHQRNSRRTPARNIPQTRTQRDVARL